MRKSAIAAKAVLGTLVVLVTSMLMPGVAAAQPEAGAQASIASTVGTPAGEVGTLGDNVEDCYYLGTYLGCSYFYANVEPEIFRVCDLVNDGRYTVARIKFGGTVFESHLIYNGCINYPIAISDGTHFGIHTGVQGYGWTAYEYGYA